MRQFAQVTYLAGVATFIVGYLTSWSQLPAKIPIRFTADGSVAATLSPGPYLALALLLVAVSAALWWRMRRGTDSHVIDLVWLVLALCELGLLAALPLHSVTGDGRWLVVGVACGVGIGAAALVMAAVAVARSSGTFRAPALSYFAEERHRAPRRAALNSLFLLAPLAAIVWVPSVAAKLVAAAGLGIGVWAIALLWSGFRYRFGANGIEVIALGGRAQFVSRDDILGCERRTVDPLRDYGGWGIRGGKERRAFVLGGRDGLAVSTRSGELFLAHSDPGRLVAHVKRIRERGT